MEENEKMKRFVAFLIAAVMLLAFVACDNGTTPPAGGTQDSGDTQKTPEGTQGGSSGNNPSGGEEEEKYVPNPDCPYTGFVGIGVQSGTGYFDDLRVNNKGADGPKDLVPKTEFQDADKVPEFHALGSTDAVKPEPIKDPTLPEDSTVDKKVISVESGKTLMIGDAVWNYYQYNVKVLPADENTVIDVYFAVKDENNYYVLTLGENKNTEVNCYKVTDGKKENAQFTVDLTLPTDAMTSVSITLDKTEVLIYANGTLILDLDNAVFAEWKGAPPASIGLDIAAPEGMSYFGVNASNVIHDGKGTWSNKVETIATMAFDRDTTTYYDCDEKNEAPDPTPEVLVGNEYGDFKDPENTTGYTGGHFKDGFILKHVRFFPRTGYSKADQDRVTGCTIEASHDGKEWVVLYTFETFATEDEFMLIDLDNNEAYEYYRFHGAAESYANVSELEFWGVEK